MPFQKTSRFVSEAYRQNARGQNCTVMIPGICNHNAETVVLHHIRAFGNSGANQKPHDFCGVYVCSACHDALERDRKLTNLPIGWDDLMCANFRTMDIAFQAGLLGDPKG